MGWCPSANEYVRRSPEGNVGRGSKSACAGLDGRSASRVSRLAWAGLGRPGARPYGASPASTSSVAASMSGAISRSTLSRATRVRSRACSASIAADEVSGR